MNRNSVSGDIIDLNLRQLGGKVSQFNSQMHLVEFDISEDCVVSYIFTITNQDKFYLQRIKPYPLSEEKYSNVQQIVEFIKKDIDKMCIRDRSYLYHSKYINRDNILETNPDPEKEVRL